MDINIIKPIGPCFGVNNAINLVLKVIKENCDKNIYLLGQIVHNDRINTKLESLGINVLDFKPENALDILSKFTKDDIVIFSAHGHDDKYEKILNEKGVLFFDATCPSVLKTFEYIQRSDEVIYIGKTNHPESLAAMTKHHNIHLYDISKPFDYSIIKTSTPSVVNQTTISMLDIKHIYEDILKHIPNAKIIPSICNACQRRQENILKIINTQAILIIGSHHSSNTMRLYEIAKENHPDKDVYLIQDAKEITNHHRKYTSISITSGTSAPIEIVEEVITKLNEKVPHN